MPPEVTGNVRADLADFLLQRAVMATVAGKNSGGDGGGAGGNAGNAGNAVKSVKSVMPFPRLVLLLDIDTQSAFEVMHTALDHLSHDLIKKTRGETEEEGEKSFADGGAAAMAGMAMAGMAVDDDGDDASLRGLSTASAKVRRRGGGEEGRRRRERERERGKGKGEQIIFNMVYFLIGL